MRGIVAGLTAGAMTLAVACTEATGEDVAPEGTEVTAANTTSRTDPTDGTEPDGADATAETGPVEVEGAWELVGVSPDEAVLRVVHVYGGCERFLGWRIDESPDAVTITARSDDRREPDIACDRAARQEVHTVVLDAPLGDRALEGCRQPDCRDHPMALWGQGLAGEVAAADDALVVNGRTESWSLDPVDGSLRWGSDGGGVWAIAGPSTAFRFSGSRVRFEVLDAVSGERRGNRIEGRPLGVVGDLVISCRDRTADDPDGGPRGTEAHDLETGELRWSVDLGCGESIDSDGEVVALRGRPSGGPDQLAIVEVATGTERARIDLGPRGGEPLIVGDEVAVTTSRRGLILVDLDDGNTRELGVEASPIGVAGGVLVAWTEAGYEGLDPASGQPIWTRPAVDRADAGLLVSGDTLFAYDGPAGEVSRLDPTTREPTWTADLGRSSSVDVTVHDDVVYATTSTSTWALDLDTGEPTWWTLTVPDDPS